MQHYVYIYKVFGSVGMFRVDRSNKERTVLMSTYMHTPQVQMNFLKHINKKQTDTLVAELVNAMLLIRKCRLSES